MFRTLWVAGLSVALSLCVASQTAFGFFHHHKKAAPAPAAEPVCDCMPVAPPCCAPVAPPCCTPAPVYSAPAPSCCGTPAPVFSAPIYSGPIYSAPAPMCCDEAPAPAPAPAKKHFLHGLFGR